MANEFPLSAMDRIIRSVDAVRVSDDAKLALLDCLVEEGRQIARKSSQLARHADRNTIMKSDVLIAKQLSD